MMGKLSPAEKAQCAILLGTCMVIVGLDLWQTQAVRKNAVQARVDGNRIFQDALYQAYGLGAGQEQAKSARPTHLRPVPPEPRPQPVHEPVDEPVTVPDEPAPMPMPEAPLPFDQIGGHFMGEIPTDDNPA